MQNRLRNLQYLVVIDRCAPCWPKVGACVFPLLLALHASAHATRSLIATNGASTNTIGRAGFEHFAPLSKVTLSMARERWPMLVMLAADKLLMA
jgi:hypothetical protein